VLGLCLYLRNDNFQKVAYGLFFLSIILETLQFIVPNRAFEIYDISANFIGVLVAYFLVKIYKFWSKP
jgi:glycopeptide antibiotics resistance protein